MPDLALHVVTEPDTEPLVQHLVRHRFLGEQADAVRAIEAARAMVARVAPRARLLRVQDGDADAGHLWLVTSGDDLSVLTLALPDAALAPHVRALVLDLARGEGARRLVTGVAPGDAVGVAFVADGGFEVMATQMRLDLASDLPGEDVVALVTMDEATFAAWEADEVEKFAAEQVLAGMTPEQAQRTSAEQHAELLPHGLATEHHHFFEGRVDGATVGTLWVGTERPMAYVYDVVVDEAHRRRGYGAGLMRAGALWARARGAHALGLNVFGHNHGARALYDRLGYDVVEEFLAAPLS